jgi:hypothetical protein
MPRLSFWLTERVVAAAAPQDAARVRHWARLLDCALNNLDVAIERDPPFQPDASAWTMPRSRWRQPKTVRPQRGKGSKKYILRKLPRNWLDTLGNAAHSNWPYKCELAVHLPIPGSPAELVPVMPPMAGRQAQLSSCCPNGCSRSSRR